MLSSQTKDEITSAATRRLIAAGCTIENVIAMPDQQLGELIYPVGFWRKKIAYLKGTARMIRDEFGGDIPASVEELCKLPGSWVCTQSVGDGAVSL
jgi:endonuclease III